MRVLIVEDDEALLGVITRGLKEEGFDITKAKDGEEGFRLAMQETFDCIILDVMLPRLDGISLCRRLRKQDRQTPVIMLTVLNEVTDRVRGLEAGADDYLGKPFSFEELLARIRALIRRGSLTNRETLRHGDISLDSAALTATRAGKHAELTPKEFQLLGYFLRNPHRIVTEQELIEKVWGLGFDPQTNILNVYLHRLRAKLHIEAHPPIIETIRGEGYRLHVGDK